MGTQSGTPEQSNLYSKMPRSPRAVPVPRSFSVSAPRPWADSKAKRLFDLIVASIGVVILLPLFAVIAILVKLTSPGPVLFRQQRVGKSQVPFTIYKYRTMYTSSESETPGSSVTRCGDHRFTSIGPYLRKCKLDELPQLFNVILGDMSLVGPRPKLPKHERMEMICKPGITGAATIVFAQEQTLLKTVPKESFEYFTIFVLNEIKAKIDREYAQTCTFWSDLRIIFATLSGPWRRTTATSIGELLTIYGHKPGPTAKSISLGLEWIN
jgi:lipopolysaccharide/colanic/teichoic acid biosynthesis glycosyltransferase